MKPARMMLISLLFCFIAGCKPVPHDLSGHWDGFMQDNKSTIPFTLTLDQQHKNLTGVLVIATGPNQGEITGFVDGIKAHIVATYPQFKVNIILDGAIHNDFSLVWGEYTIEYGEGLTKTNKFTMYKFYIQP